MDSQKVPQGMGSGFFWDDQGHIVTNFHVIKGAADIKVALIDQSVWSAKVSSAVACFMQVQAHAVHTHQGWKSFDIHSIGCNFAAAFICTCCGIFRTVSRCAWCTPCPRIRLIEQVHWWSTYLAVCDGSPVMVCVCCSSLEGIQTRTLQCYSLNARPQR